MTLKLKLTLPGLLLILAVGLVSSGVLVWIQRAHVQAEGAVNTSRIAVQRLYELSEVASNMNALSMSLASLTVAKAPSEKIMDASVKASGQAETLLSTISILKGLDLPLKAGEKAAFIDSLERYQEGVSTAVVVIVQDPVGSVSQLQDLSAGFERIVQVKASILSRLEANVVQVADSARQGNARLIVIFVAGLAALTLVAVTAAYLVTSRLVGPLQVSTTIMRRLAGGDLDLDVPHTDRRDEIGSMARAIETFRLNGLQIAELNRQEESLKAMSGDLQRSINAVVSAAVSGDFSGRVTKSYDREDLDQFAISVNQLMSSVERGIGETRKVIAALADGDLTQSMDGRYDGAFRELQDNVNVTLDILRQVLGQVGETVGTVGQMSEEIRSGASDLSRRSEMQAADRKSVV